MSEQEFYLAVAVGMLAAILLYAGLYIVIIGV
jgi:hypothetical protein